MVKQCFVCKKLDYLNPELSFHRFPSNVEKKRMYLSLLNMHVDAENEMRQFALICSSHFRESDFEFRGPTKMKWLKKDAMPIPFEVHTDVQSSSESTTDGTPPKRFPLNTSRKAEWLRRLGFIDNPSPSKCALVCSHHFNPDDIDVKPSGTRLLKNNTVQPLLHLPNSKHPLVSASSYPTIDCPTGDEVVTQSEIKTETSSSDDDYLVNNPSPVISTQAGDAPIPCTSHDDVESAIDAYVVGSPPPIMGIYICGTPHEDGYHHKPRVEAIESSSSSTTTASEAEEQLALLLLTESNHVQSIPGSTVEHQPSCSRTVAPIHKPTKSKQDYAKKKTNANYRKMMETVRKQRKAIISLKKTVRNLRKRITMLNGLLKVLTDKKYPFVDVIKTE